MLQQENLDHGLVITIVMPCLNEEETLKACIEEALVAIEACGVPGEVVIADNGSTDGSRMIAEQAGFCNNGQRWRRQYQTGFQWRNSDTQRITGSHETAPVFNGCRPQSKSVQLLQQGFTPAS